MLFNNLEDEKIISEDGNILGFIKDIDLAKELDCGVATVHAYIKLGGVKAFKVDQTYYIPMNTLDPK